MTKLDLTQQLARAEGISQAKAQSVIENVLDLIICHFQEGGSQVTLRGFGTLKTRKRRAFTGTDPRTKENINVPEKLSVTFKPSAELLRRIN